MNGMENKYPQGQHLLTRWTLWTYFSITPTGSQRCNQGWIFHEYEHHILCPLCCALCLIISSTSMQENREGEKKVMSSAKGSTSGTICKCPSGPAPFLGATSWLSLPTGAHTEVSEDLAVSWNWISLARLSDLKGKTWKCPETIEKRENILQCSTE